MRFNKLLLAFFVIVALATGRLMATTIPVAEPVRVVWFSGHANHGLRQDSNGNLIATHQKLIVEKPVSRLFAAAWYRPSETLVTVDQKAVTRLYKKTGTHFQLMQTRPPHGVSSPSHQPSIRPVIARFSNIQGLVYLTWSYLKPPSPSQTATQFTERQAFGRSARDWHAVTSIDPNVTFLKTTYRVVSPRVIYLYLPDAPRTIVHLPDALAPIGSSTSPYVDLEPVFILHNRILCKTSNGWSMHYLNGNLIRYFPSAQYGREAWDAPIYKNGQFYVVQAIKDTFYYRLDVPTGRLVYVGRTIK